MTERGFALLAVLWVITALTALTGAGMIVARLGNDTTRNRILLARAEWAREACGEILQARFAHDPAIRQLEPIDLGRGTWCQASIVDPAAQLNLNTADSIALARLFAFAGAGRQVIARAIALRRGGTIYDVRAITGVDSELAVALAPLVTTRGTGVVNVNAAPLAVLGTLPGLTEEAVQLLVARRGARPLHNADELAGALSRSSRDIFLRSYAEFVRSTVFDAPQLVATIAGGVRGTPIVARATLTLVPVPGRLAVIHRETE
jgi:type II secretory pathway component PulK